MNSFFNRFSMDNKKLRELQFLFLFSITVYKYRQGFLEISWLLWHYIHTPSISLCSQSADPNPFRGTAFSIILRVTFGVYPPQIYTYIVLWSTYVHVMKIEDYCVCFSIIISLCIIFCLIGCLSLDPAIIPSLHLIQGGGRSPHWF